MFKKCSSSYLLRISARIWKVEWQGNQHSASNSNPWGNDNSTDDRLMVLWLRHPLAVQGVSRYK
ncbi:unnamed protein product, partial [Nesidiocoris tenuis]